VFEEMMKKEKKNVCGGGGGGGRRKQLVHKWRLDPESQSASRNRGRGASYTRAGN